MHALGDVHRELCVMMLHLTHTHSTGTRCACIMDAPAAGQAEGAPSVLQLLPDDFLDFCRKSGVDVEEFSMIGKLPRYLRFVKGTPPAQRVGIMRHHFPDAAPVEHFLDDAVWRLPHEQKVRNSPVFSSGTLAGIDLGSIMAVMALDIGPQDTVLDLCCAPGSKLQLMSELTSGRLTGVDVDLYRLSATRSCLQKYKRDSAAHIRLVLADGVTYDPTATAAPWWCGTRTLLAVNPSRHRKKLASTYPQLPQDTPCAGIVLHDYAGEMRRPAKRKKGEAPQPEEGIVVQSFNRVLVDAECTTDGSLRHVEKLIERGEAWAERSEWGRKDDGKDLFELQTSLLRKGISLANEGAVVVYSTCSLSPQQNEAVVSEVLRDGTVELLPPFDLTHPSLLGTPPPHKASATLQHTVYFTPKVSNCGTIYIAKMRKIQAGPPFPAEAQPSDAASGLPGPAQLAPVPAETEADQPAQKRQRTDQ
eukprot:TRINITY_DN10484_c0_g1_i1.p1 TRINITY_DN10484_c0_g1~~TRINITY_DN10484_c0_g1_i1.p1  ORF type:complete len:475 (+),score=180.29 TRINITY_DN10484_c0_g1_i1:409-1833(+)